MTFIIVLLASACDFWTVKNVSGRLLVGLRWRSEILPDGSEKWHFESHTTKKPNPVDRRVFWWSQMGATIFWSLFAVLKIISFDFFWAVCCCLCLSLTGTNYWGYHKCSKDQQAKMSKLMEGQRNKVTGWALGYLQNGMMGKFFGGNQN
mmetsp:Transcript_17300/g.15206  ORF Transcript_17300/g.15206 Transcript_17300/m.15206 type:complete len:149 (+) Transcript_17300:286-732(+)